MEEDIKNKKMSQRESGEAGKPSKKIRNAQGHNARDDSLGLLKVEHEIIDGVVTGARVQQHHNASHALWYLSMVIHSIVNGKTNWSNEAKTKRILAHLACLQEFITNEEFRLQSNVSMLFERLETHNPSSGSEWILFVHSNWVLIRDLAAHYRVEEECFSDKDYLKIVDIIHGRHGFTAWWWKAQIKKMGRSARKNYMRIAGRIGT